MPFRTNWLVGALALAPAPGWVPAAWQDVERSLRAGEAVAGSFEGSLPELQDVGPAAIWEIAPRPPGVVTLHLRSLDFDPRLLLLDVDGEVVAQDDDGGLATNAQLTMELAPGAVYRVAVTGRGVGDYELELEPGRPTDPTGAERRDLEIDFHARAAERATARGDVARAVGHLVRQGELLDERGALERARAILEEALGVAADLGDQRLEARAALHLGEALAGLGAYASARDHLERALRLCEGSDASYEAARAHLGLVLIARRNGDWDEAALQVGRAEAAFPPGEDPELAMCVLLERGALRSLLEGDREEAAEVFERVRERARTSGARALEARALVELAGLSTKVGDLVAARDELEGALGHARWSGNRATEATALALLALVHQRLGSAVRSDELSAQALELATATGSHWAELFSHRQSALALRDRGDKLGALQHRTAELALAVSAGSPWLEAWARQGLARVLLDMGRAEEASRHVEPALALARRVGDQDLELLLLGDLGIVHWFASDLAASGRAFEAQGELAGELGDPHGQANARNSLAAVRANQGQVERAIELAAEALELFQRVNDRPGQINALSNLGAFERRRGDPLQARQYFEEAVRLCESWGMKARTSNALLGLGNLAHDIADYARAESYCRRAIELALETGSPALQALEFLADVRCHLGDFEAARACAEQLLEAGDPYDARALHILASVAGGEAEWQRAAEYLEKALDLLRSRGQESKVGMELTELAFVSIELGDPERAIELGEERLALAREQGYSYGEAAALSVLGSAWFALGDTDRAEALARESLARSERHGWVMLAMNTSYLVAEIELARGETAAVRSAIDKVERVLDGPATHALETIDASQWRARSYEWARVSQELFALELEQVGENARARRRVLRDGLLSSGRWKSRGLLEGIVEHREGGRTREAVTLRRERRDAQAMRDQALQQVATIATVGASAAEIDALRAEAGRWDARAEETARRLEEVSPRDAAVDLPRGVGPEVVRAEVLRGNGALIEYAEGLDRLYAYVLDEAGLHHVDLGPLDAVTTCVDRYFAHLSDPGHGSPGALAEAGRAAYETLLAPALGLLEENVERLVVVPTTRLAGLPFEALVLPGEAQESVGDLEFVIDRWSIVYGPSSPVLVELARHPPRERAGRVLVLADPRYSGEPVAAPPVNEAATQGIFGGLAVRRGPRDLARLPKTREEAFALTRAMLALAPTDEATAGEFLRLQDRRSGSLSGPLFDLFLGADASPKPLSGDLRAYSVLHFAAHGYVDGKNARNTGIALSFGEGQDGYFTAADALELDLDADLVVLSACDTARGDLRAGMGVQSMARAFMYAGARGVIASLWQVEDSAAAETMSSFYEHLLKSGHPPDRALRAAKLAVRRGAGTRGVRPLVRSGADSAPSSHPFYWAPFVYLGAAR